MAPRLIKSVYTFILFLLAEAQFALQWLFHLQLYRILNRMSQKPWRIKVFKVTPIQLFAAIQTNKLSKQQTTRYSSILQLLNRSQTFSGHPVSTVSSGTECWKLRYLARHSWRSTIPYKSLRIWLFLFLIKFLRAASRNYQLQVEIVKKWPPLKLRQNEALWALVTKSLV